MNNITPPTYGTIGVWQSIADSMPDDEMTVIVWDAATATACLAYHDSQVRETKGSGWIIACTSRRLTDVTHWCDDILPPSASFLITDH